MEELRLTMREWGIAQSQCSQCRLWNQVIGCIYEQRADEYPVENCRIFGENKILATPDKETK